MTACPLCGGAQAPFVARDRMKVVRCHRCGLGALAHGDVAANQAYEGVYREAADAHPLTLQRYDELLDLAERYRSRGVVLEIGFGDGALLRRAEERGWQAIGTETAVEAVTKLSQHGIDARLGEHAALTVTAGSCDVVAMLEVLEHVEDFRAALAEAHHALRPGGAIMLTTPNADSLTRRIIGGRWRVFADEHRWYFTPSSLRRALRAAGFALVSLRSRNVYPPEIWAALRRRPPGCGRTVSANESALREFSRRSPVGRALRTAANALLTATDTGDTLWGLAVRN